MPPKILITLIDDNPGSLEMTAAALQQDGVAIHTFLDPEAALEYILTQHPQIVLTDLMMPHLSGMEVLERVIEFDPSIDVLLVTAHYTTESAVEAIKKGAADYLNKPVSLAGLRQRVQSLIEKHRRVLTARQLEASLAANVEFDSMVGNSPAMWELFSQVRRVAPHYRSVLVQGATGTGKELVARAIHQLSPVANGQFVALNCSAVVETLFESELFGHVRGAFTGATQDKVGLFEYASNGTLFLDEIGDMPLSTQAKLLRALQNQEVQPLGSLVTRKVNVRIIAATHQNLRSLVSQGRFREDLFYRLSMIELKLPTLAEREGDLRLLTHHFLDKFAKSYGKEVNGLTNRAQMVLSRHDWPGNVRELENVIGHACIMVMGSLVDVADLPAYLTQTKHPNAGASAQAVMAAGLGQPISHFSGHGDSADNSQRRSNTELPSLEEQERSLILSALEKAGANQSQAARLLRISRDTLRYRLKKHGIGGH